MIQVYLTKNKTNLILSKSEFLKKMMYLSLDPGFYCLSRSESQQPIQKSYGDLCPEGKYCPRGTSFGENCPPSTFSNTTGKPLNWCITNHSSNGYLKDTLRCLEYRGSGFLLTKALIFFFLFDMCPA